MRSRSLVFVALAAALGCSSTPDPEDTANMNNPCPPGQYCPSATPTATTTTPTPTPTATGTGTASGTACSPIAAGAFATPLLVGLQQSEAPGMQAEGQSAAGQCGEGQSFEIPLTMQPGKCYTVVAVSMGVQELDAKIAAQPLPQLPPTPLAQDSNSGGQAVVGGKGSCFKNAAPLAVPAKVIVTATRGSGAAVAQIYVK
jgi:hypothetical protein